MKDVKNLSIWKREEPKNSRNEEYLNADIGDLNLRKYFPMSFWAKIHSWQTNATKHNIIPEKW